MFRKKTVNVVYTNSANEIAVDTRRIGKKKPNCLKCMDTGSFAELVRGTTQIVTCNH